MVGKHRGRVEKPGSKEKVDDGTDSDVDQPWVKPNPRITPNTPGKQIGFYRREGMVVGGHEDYEEDDMRDEYEYESYPDNE